MSQSSEQANIHKTIPSNHWGEDVLIEKEFVERNFSELKKQVAHYKSRIIAVTKYYGLNSIVTGYEVGMRDFGESRAVESIEKIKSLPQEIRENSRFHFIGHLQTNKVEKVVEFFDYIHSVDSLKVAKAISQAACRLDKREKVLLQVNNANEEQKFGYDKEVLREEFRDILNLEGLEVIGLMNMAPLGASSAELRTVFGGLRQFRDELEKEFNVRLPELSMGMSNDYQIALEEGATIIRVGRKLFIK